VMVVDMVSCPRNLQNSFRYQNILNNFRFGTVCTHNYTHTHTHTHTPVLCFLVLESLQGGTTRLRTLYGEDGDGDGDSDGGSESDGNSSLITSL
jgi:hypothetical protein